MGQGLEMECWSSCRKLAIYTKVLTEMNNIFYVILRSAYVEETENGPCLDFVFSRFCITQKVLWRWCRRADSLKMTQHCMKALLVNLVLKYWPSSSKFSATCFLLLSLLNQINLPINQSVDMMKDQSTRQSLDQSIDRSTISRSHNKLESSKANNSKL